MCFKFSSIVHTCRNGTQATARQSSLAVGREHWPWRYYWGEHCNCLQAPLQSLSLWNLQVKASSEICWACLLYLVLKGHDAFYSWFYSIEKTAKAIPTVWWTWESRDGLVKLTMLIGMILVMLWMRDGSRWVLHQYDEMLIYSWSEMEKFCKCSMIMYSMLSSYRVDSVISLIGYHHFMLENRELLLDWRIWVQHAMWIHSSRYVSLSPLLGPVSTTCSSAFVLFSCGLTTWPSEQPFSNGGILENINFLLMKVISW